MAETVQTKVRLDLKAALREGINLWRDGLCVEALNHFKSIRHFFDESEPVYLRQYYCDLGLSYRCLGQTERAIEEYEKALSVKGECDESDIAAIHANLAYAFLSLNRPHEALVHLEQPEEYFTRTFEYFHLGEVLETKARAELSLGRQSALETARRAFDLLSDCGDSQAVERVSRTLAMARSFVGPRGITK